MQRSELATMADKAQYRRLLQRWLTLGGNRAGYSLGSGVTSATVTLAPEEFDDQYGVVATPSWGTTVWVTGKQVGQFTLNFGTATPDANQTVDIAVFREE